MTIKEDVVMVADITLVKIIV